MTVENEFEQLAGVQPEDKRVYQFKEPDRLETFVKLVIYAKIVAVAAACVLLAQQLQLLYQTVPGIPDAFREPLQTNAEYQQMLWPAQLVLGAAAFFAQIVWIQRLNHNAHALGAKGMWYTPLSCFVSFFIPLANLFQPYEAVAELSKASANPAEWKQQPAAHAAAWWWWIYLLSIAVFMYGLFVGAFVLGRMPDVLFVQQRMVTASIAHSLLFIAQFLIFIPMMSAMSRQQMAHRQGAAASLDGQA